MAAAYAKRKGNLIFMGDITENGRREERLVQNLDKEKEYALSLSGIFDELLECSLNTGEIETVFNTLGKEGLSENSTMEELKEFARNKIHPQDCDSFLHFFEYDNINKLWGQEKVLSLSFRLCVMKGGYTWKKAVLVPASGRKSYLLCYVIDLGSVDRESFLLRQVVDHFVYKSCDYLICINMKQDSFTLLCRNDTPGPLLADRDRYSSMSQTLVTQYAAAEDRDMLGKEMESTHVLLALEREGEYTVTYGMLAGHNGYMRKRLQYRYYDKSRALVLLMQTDITKEYTELRRHKERLTDALRHARMDSLTGIYNRQAAATRISRLLAEQPGTCSVLLFLDLDNFKMVNDTLGHRMGDLVLRQAADLFRQELDEEDVIGRVGGDEFVVFLPGISSPEEAKGYASRLCGAMEHIPALKDKPVRLSCSVGGAICPVDGNDYDSLLVRADAAVYEAKRRGKNQYAFFGPDVELTAGEHFPETF